MSKNRTTIINLGVSRNVIRLNFCNREHFDLDCVVIYYRAKIFRWNLKKEFPLPPVFDLYIEGLCNSTLRRYWLRHLFTVCSSTGVPKTPPNFPNSRGQCKLPGKGVMQSHDLRHIKSHNQRLFGSAFVMAVVSNHPPRCRAFSRPYSPTHTDRPNKERMVQ